LNLKIKIHQTSFKRAVPNFKIDVDNDIAIEKLNHADRIHWVIWVMQVLPSGTTIPKYSSMGVNVKFKIETEGAEFSQIEA
jgi:hypothetical protein